MINELHVQTIRVDILEQALREIAESPDMRGKDLFMVNVAITALKASAEVRARALADSNKRLATKLVDMHNDASEARERS